MDGDLGGQAARYETPLDRVEDFVHAAEPEEFSPFAFVDRLMRGRWLALIGLCAVFAGALAVAGFGLGKKSYESTAIIRIAAREPNILYANADDSRLKLFQSFVKGETTYVASRPVMERAVQIITAASPEYDGALTAEDLADSISIRRAEALIVISSPSESAAFAAQKVNAVIDAYIALHEEGKESLSSFRQKELAAREAELLARFEEVKATMLEVGGEYGSASLVKAHIEKVGQIDGLMARQGEVRATLEALRSKTSAAGADVADQHILRATLLDRSLADLNFDKSKREAELQTLLQRYAGDARQVREKRQEIEVLDKAMQERREQIRVLSQTGALTAGGDENQEESEAEIQALLDKVTGKLQAARAEARSLNGKRIELNFLEEERDELRRMLDETRRALDVIQLESRNSMPGMVEVMSRPVVSDKPAKDTAKLFAAAGFVGGGGLAFVIFMAWALTRGRLRFSDDLWSHVWQTPILHTIGARAMKSGEAWREINRARNAILLFPSAAPVGDRARIIAVSRLDAGDSRTVAAALADSFAATGMRSLMIDADLGGDGAAEGAGWREMITGGDIDIAEGEAGAADRIGAGLRAGVTDETASVHGIRGALARHAQDYEVIVVNAGGLGESLSCELVLSAADLGVAVARSGDRSARVRARIGKVHAMPRNGGGIVFTHASRRDPGLAA